MLAAVTGLLLAIGGVLVYFRAEVVDERAFSGRVTASLDDSRVRAVVADRVVVGLVEASSGDLLAVRPLVVRATEAIVGTQLFRRVASVAVRDAHRALVSGNGSVIVNLKRGVPVLVDALRSVSPAAAARASADRGPVVGELEAGNTELGAVRRLIDLSRFGWLFLVAAALAGSATFALAGGVRRSLAYLGAAAAGAGALVAALVTVGRTTFANHVAAGSERGAVGVLWNGLFGDLRTAALFVAAGGVIAVAAAAVQLRSRRLAVGLGLAALIAAASVAAVIALSAPSPPAEALASQPSGGCNGLPKLCDRRIDDVVFAATHNSYAAADEPGWLFANQRYPISRQLTDGIRGLLIDIHHGVLDKSSGRVRTDLRADGSDRNKAARALSPEALQAADRLAGRVGAGELGGPSKLYLCHTLCELGAEPLDQELTVIRHFLERKPNQVLLVIVEDYVPPTQIEKAFERNGLLRYVAAFDRSAPLPTLGDLIDRGKRLVVFAEEAGGKPAWYMPAFSFIQDTPYSARRPSELSCSRYRGDASSPLLLLNHWIARFPPRVSDQVSISGSYLEDRVKRCTAKRGIVGAIVAVDFYERMGVIEAARKLNDRAR